MKKIISFILTLCMLCSIGAYAAPDSEAVLRVQALGIMQGDENGMRLEDSITRAEFAAIICRLAGIPSPDGMTAAFIDVPADHWAKDYIAAAVSLDIVNGMGNGTFAPDANITYNQALKMMVCLLGYGSVAENKGGWPNGYVAQAGILGLTDNADLSAANAVRGEIITIIDNALDAHPLSPDYGNSGSYTVEDNTLAEKLEKNSDAEKFEGIFTENAYKSIINATPVTEDGYVTVDSVTYKSNSDYSDLVGYYVFGWVRENEKGRQEVVCMEADKLQNTALELDCEDTDINDGYASYFDESNKEKKFNISSDAVYTYNGRYTTNKEAYINSDSGKFVLIDNNGDKKADVVEIINSESFVISKLNASNSSVYFADDKLFRGKRGFELESDDDNKKIKLKDSEGNLIEFASLEINNAISLSVSEDLNLVSAVVSAKTVSGIVEEKDSEGRVAVAGTFYDTDLNLRIGQEADFILDADGVIVGIIGTEKTDLKYGYIAKAAHSVGIDNSLKLLIIEGTAPEKEVKVKDGNETISYYLQNDTEKEYECNTKIKYSLDRVDGVTNTIDSLTLNPDILEGSIAGYALDSEGKIRTLCVYNADSSQFLKCELNAELLSFGGGNVDRGFCTNDNTQIICVPKKVNTMSDYGVRVYITDNSPYYVYGVTGRSDYNIYDRYEKEKYNRETVDVLLVLEDMDSSRPYPIQEDASICIVGESVEYVDSDGEHARKLEILNGDKVIELVADSDSPAYDVAKTLRMGDLIQYVTGSNGKLKNINKRASVQGLRTYSNTGNLYGEAYDISYSSYDYMKNDIADFIEVSFGGELDNKVVKFFNDGEQVIYLYNRSRGYIEAATTDDIITLQQSSGNASKLFVLTKNNDAEAVVIIND